MKHPWKRSLACLVALLLMLQLLPTGALAAGRDPGGRVAQVEAADASLSFPIWERATPLPRRCCPKRPKPGMWWTRLRQRSGRRSSQWMG